MNNPEYGNKTFDDYLNFTYKTNPLYFSDNKNKPDVKQKDDRNRARKSCGNGARKSCENGATNNSKKKGIRAN